MRIPVLVACLVAGPLLGAGSCFAQESRAAILGRVTDSSGAVIIGARVHALNVATNAGASSVTNEGGSYEIPYLLPGQYRVTVEMPGFKKGVRDGIELRVNDRLALDFRLEVGAVSESIVVTGETPLLESTSASIGIVLDQKRVSELPVVGGGPYYMARLSPGILSVAGRYAGNPIDQGAATEIIVNGTRSFSSETLLDGSPNMVERNTPFSPPQDMVQEFKIHTATFDASLGHAAGAVSNVSLKSGTNRLHGTGYWFDSRLRGVPWFTNRFIYDPRTGPITPEKESRALEGWLHQRWGGTMTGPVVIPKLYNGRNKTFWSFGYEGLYIKRNLGFTGTVPTPAQRRGDFSELLRLESQYQIYDPLTTAAAPGGRFSRQPIPGNVIPAQRLNAVALNLLKYWPEQNQPGTSDARQNYFRTRDINRDNRNLVLRLDHNFSEKHRAFFRWHNAQHDNKTNELPTIASGDILDRTGYGLALDDVYVFNPQLLLNVRYSLSHQNPYNSRFSQGFDLLSLGLPQSLLEQIQTKNNPAGIAFPQVVVDGSAYTDLGANGGETRTIYYQNFGATVTKMTGGHSVRFGGEYRLMRENGYSFGNVAPRFEFSTNFTRGPLDNSTGAPIGQGLASMLLGIPTGGRINNNASYAEQSTYTSFFIQDDWRLTSKLTLNVGLRYEYESPTTERFNRSIRDFDFATASPVETQAQANYARSPIPEVPVSAFRTLGGLRFAGVGGQPRELWGADRNNLAPRIGLAYHFRPKTVLRAGYGVFYDVMGIDRTDVNLGGFNQPTNLIPTLDNGLTYRATLSNPFPDGLEVPLGAAGGLRTFLGRGVSFFNDRPLNPYMQRWSFSVQQEVPGRLVVEAAYVGNRGTKLAVDRQLNSVPRQYLSTSLVRDQATIDFLSAQVTNPFAGIPEFAGTGLAAVRVNRSQLLRPYPHFLDITVRQPAGYSYFHSLQVQADKRMSHGLNFQASWTWSKFMEAASYLHETDPVLEKVVSDQDYTHRLVFSTIYELPFGRGKPVLRNARGVLDGFIGGWQLQAWFEGQSGQTLGFGNAIFNGDLGDIPLPVSQRRAERWFNTEAGFDRDTRRQLANNIRTFPSRFSGVRSDGINNFDFSLFKHFRIREGLKAQFRMEAFNALNHVQFANPNTTPTSTTFGSLTGEKGHGQRQITFAVKLMF